VVTNLFEPKIPDLRLHDRQDLPIEALRENDSPDWTYDFLFGLIVILVQRSNWCDQEHRI